MAEEVQIISRIRHRDHYRFLIGVGSICGDVAVIGAAAPISSWLRFDDIISGNAADLLVAILFPYLLGALLFNAFQVEHLRNPASSIRRAVTAFVVSFTVAVVAAFAFKVSDSYSRLEIGYLIFIVILGLILWRQTLSWIVAKWFALIV
ncbi:MAG: hypothetical protein QGG19_16360, partial [Alphaproteobacteria bacterium]|nr:hypothetical protein [Alphaproteobacteria bacterium]